MLLCISQSKTFDFKYSKLGFASNVIKKIVALSTNLFLACIDVLRYPEPNKKK